MNRNSSRRAGVALLAALALSTVASVGGAPAASAALTTPETDAPSPDDVDPDGILRFGTPLVLGVGIHFDPTQLRLAYGMSWLDLVYGTLVRQADDGSYQPWMAESVEIVDPQTVRITTREGVTFTDGAPYDAEAVKISLMRQRFESASDAVALGVHAGLLALESVDVVDPLIAEVHLDQPIASVFVESLASLPGLVHSPKQVAEDPEAIDLAPVGAGPYILEEYVEEQRIVLSRNPDFWDADSWQLGGIEFVHTPAGAPQATGILADALDVAAIPVDSVAAMASDDDVSVDVLPGRFVSIGLCATKPPFDDPAVRHALNIGIDREGFNELVYGGLGVPAHGFYPEGHPSYDPAAAELLAYDPDTASQLLADSGVEDLSWEIVLAPALGFDRHAEVVQAQVQKLGMDTTITSYENTYVDWIDPQKPGGMLVFVVGQPAGSWTYFARHFVQGQANAFCGNEDPEVMALVDQAAQLSPGDPEAVELYRQANLMTIEHAYTIPIVFQPAAIAWNNGRLGGTPTYTTETGEPRLRFDSIYVRS